VEDKGPHRVVDQDNQGMLGDKVGGLFAEDIHNADPQGVEHQLPAEVDRGGGQEGTLEDMYLVGDVRGKAGQKGGILLQGHLAQAVGPHTL